MFTGDISPVEVFSLVVQLPEQSRTKAHYRGGEHYEGWSVDRYLRAAQIDAVNMNTYMLAKVNSRSKPKEPTPVETPDQIDKKKQKEKNESNPFAMKVFQELDKLKEQE